MRLMGSVGNEKRLGAWLRDATRRHAGGLLAPDVPGKTGPKPKSGLMAHLRGLHAVALAQWRSLPNWEADALQHRLTELDVRMVGEEVEPAFKPASPR